LSGIFKKYDSRSKKETKTIFAGSFEALKHGIPPLGFAERRAEGRNFKAETLAKILAGNFACLAEALAKAGRFRKNSFLF
jgi:hypothetical protein